MKRQIITICGALLAGIAFYCLPHEQTPKPLDTPARNQPEITSRSAVQPASASMTAPKNAPPTSDQRHMLALPDGSFVKALNEAIDPPPLKDYWGPFEWSPIVGTERSSAGIEWYRHADGSYSTTQMVMRNDLGRMAAMTRVAHPGPAPAKPSIR